MATDGYHTLQEIAELIQQDLINCDDFKDFTSWICCETYPDPNEHERMMDAIEKEWPTFTDDRQLGHVPGSRQQLGRLVPNFSSFIPRP